MVGEEKFQLQWVDGERLSMDEAIDLATKR
jgi:hypothetical protein